MGGTTTSTTTTTTTTAQSVGTSQAATFGAASAHFNAPYYVAYIAAMHIPGNDANALAAANFSITAEDDLSHSDPAQAVLDGAAALATIKLYNAAHPNDPNGIATEAAMQYDVDHPPTLLAANSAQVVAAMNAATYLVTTTTTTTTTNTLVGVSLGTTAGAASAATLLSAALASVSTMRASIGASEAQLTATSDILGIQVQNFTGAQSQIQDANIADDVVNLTKFQILNQSGTAALSKSNQTAQQILALMQ